MSRTSVPRAEMSSVRRGYSRKNTECAMNLTEPAPQRLAQLPHVVVVVRAQLLDCPLDVTFVRVAHVPRHRLHESHFLQTATKGGQTLTWNTTDRQSLFTTRNSARQKSLSSSTPALSITMCIEQESSGKSCETLFTPQHTPPVVIRCTSCSVESARMLRRISVRCSTTVVSTCCFDRC